MSTNALVPNHRYRRLTISLNVLADAAFAIEQEEDREVRRDVQEPEHAEIAADGDQPVPARDGTKRRDHERKRDEHQADEPGRQDREVDVVDAELMPVGIPHEQHSRHRAIDDDEPLGERRVENALSS